jgi:3-hydroxyisobutyrate dehydrogenase
MTRVGFAGIGRMGAPMATNLARSGFQLTLWNRNIEKAEQLASVTNAVVSATPRELAERSDVVITMLADDHASDEVHRGDGGLLSADDGAHHLIEMGTLSPRHVRQLAADAGHRTVIDAPVSGSTDAAREATLMIMVGATNEAIDPVRPVLAALSREIICLGTTGAGATMKLAVNMLIHGLNQTLAESLTLAEAAGISPAVAYRAIEESAAAAPMLGYRKPNYLDEAHTPVSFALALARKDEALAIELATELGVPMPQTQLNLSQLQGAEAAGFGERDMASIIDYLRSTT